MRKRSRPSKPENPRKRSRPSKPENPNSTECSSSPKSILSFSDLPYDVLVKIAAPFDPPDLKAASLVCTAWRDELKPLREAVVLLFSGNRFKHGRGGEEVNLDKALDCFLKGAARGSTLAMVEAGRIYWGMEKKREAAIWYRKAAELGDPAGQCEFAISILQGDPQNSKEAIKLLYKASVAGRHVCAQYQLANSFYQGLGVKKCPKQAAQWFRKAAAGGHVRAMYKTAHCYFLGEGVRQSDGSATKWMKRAASFGHTDAQLEHGLRLYSEGNMTKALVFLELAARAGQTDAATVRNTILQEMSEASRATAMLVVDKWLALSLPLGECCSQV